MVASSYQGVMVDFSGAGTRGPLGTRLGCRCIVSLLRLALAARRRFVHRIARARDGGRLGHGRFRRSPKPCRDHADIARLSRGPLICGCAQNVRSRPACGETFGIQPSKFRATLISGQRREGSSGGLGVQMMGLELPTAVITICARWRTVISCGLPRFTTQPGNSPGAAASKDQAMDQIAYIAKTARLTAIAVQGDGRPRACLGDELRQGTRPSLACMPGP